MLGIVGIVFRKTVVNNSIAVVSQTAFDKGKIAMENGIGYIEFDGVISLDKPADSLGLFPAGESPAEQIASAFEYYAHNPYAKAIVISINSPGGSIVACDETLKRMQKAKEESPKPVVVVFRSVAASGGYYIAMIADEIYASEGTLTGSIGVIMQSLNFSELMNKHGVKAYSFVSGKNKDSLSPFREVRETEEEYFNSLVVEMLENFTDKVEASRGKKLKGYREDIFDGRIFSGKRALEAGLIDRIGTKEDAIARAAELGGLETPKPFIIPYINNDYKGIFRKIFLKSNFKNIFYKETRIENMLKNSEFISKYQGIPMYFYAGSYVWEQDVVR